MKIKPGVADAYARNPGASCVLVYGPDLGLVAERGRALRESVLGSGPPDPFRYAEPAARDVAADTASLVDEAAALSLAGGRRVVRIAATGDATAEAFNALLQAREGRDAAPESLVIAEAGDLGPRSALRRLFEQADHAAAVPCYVDEGDSLVAFAHGVLRGLGHEVDRAALQWIASALGGDRAVLRGELEKLSVYAGDGARITTADAEACLGDSAAVSLDAAALAAAAGNLATLDRALGRCFSGGQGAVAVLRALNRTLTRIQLATGMVEAGKTADAALKSLRPPVYWKEKEVYLEAVTRWSSAKLARAIEILGAAELDCKRTGVPDQAVAWLAALRIAGAARRKA